MTMPGKINPTETAYMNSPEDVVQPDEVNLMELQKRTQELYLGRPQSDEAGDVASLAELASQENLPIVTGKHPSALVNQDGMSSSRASTPNVRSSTDSLSLLEGIRTRSVPTPLSSESSTTEPGTGFLHNLTSLQRGKLFDLWGMLLEYLERPFDSLPAKKQPKGFVASLLEQTRQKAHNCFDITFTEDQSNRFDANPLTDELFYQFGTDDPDRILLRFLRARKWVVTDAFNMLVDSLKWRVSIGLRKLMVDGERRIKSSLLEGGKNFFWKKDNEGRLMCYVRSRLHDKNAQTLQESIDFTIFSVEWGRRLRDNDDQLVSILFDLRDAPLASLDISILQFMVSTLQSFYPEILGKCLIKDAPWIFSGFWKLVRPLLDPDVAKKIVFLKQEEIPQYIAKKDIPQEYGGDDPYVFRYVQPDPINDFQPRPDENESAQLLASIQVLRARFVEATREMHLVISRIENLQDLERVLVLVKERRDDIKRQIGELFRRLDCLVLPKTYYHRVGVLDDENQVHWDEYALPPPPEIRMSAPPALSVNITNT